MRNAYSPKPPPALTMAVRFKTIRDISYFWIIAAMIWAVFYQNLPGDIFGSADAGGGGGGEVAGPPAANVFDRMIKFGMLGMSAYIISTRWSIARNLMRNLNPGLVAMYSLAGVSMLWSIDSTATGLRFVSLSAIMLACFAFGLASWHPRRLQQVVIVPLLVILALSLIVGAVNPKLVTEVGESISLKGAWRGIMLTKNVFGMTASVTVILCANAWLSKEKLPWWALPGGVIAGLCLLFSRSSTSLLATMLAILSMFLIIRVPLVRQRFTPHVAISVASLILLYQMVIQNVIPGVDVLLSPITALTGKDTTFSARTVIWRVIKDHIQLSPLLGTGYGAYWGGPVPTSPSYIFLSVMSWYPTESHNGYLEVVNDLGWVGLSCVLLFIYFYIRQALRLMQSDRAQAALFLAVLFQEMILNMSESDWISRSNTFMILVLASVCMARALSELRLQGGVRVQASQPAMTRNTGMRAAVRRR